MLDFNQYMSRHGEHGVQAIIERLERYEGIKSDVSISLEQRWDFLMNDIPLAANSQQALAA